MNDSFGIAQVIDLVIAFTAIECVALVAYHRATGKGVAPRDFLVNMASGLCLMLALRGAVRDAGIAWIALFLLAAGLAHGADILRRWRGNARSPSTTRRVTP